MHPTNLKNNTETLIYASNEIDLEINSIELPRVITILDIVYRKRKTKSNSMVWVLERTIPTEWLPLVSEVSVNFCE
jgi:hypothetical protein